MGKLINIGYGNVVNAERILAVITPDSAPAKRIISRSKEKEVLIDATQGRKTKSILITDTEKVILSALLPETITGRVSDLSKN
ncbi:MAG: DUF370 domain-containing protein [Lachnospiraceae bacterium]|jgi:hypothetical protein|nr:DUF370 domain-containing protein [Lachnospiraceae bacterium]